MMALPVHVQGQGAPLLMIHGWAMNAAVMAVFAQALSADFEVKTVDLPGHGSSEDGAPWVLDAVVAQLASQIDRPVICLGWSLGGMLALRLAARYPEKVQRLVLLSSSPRFVTADDWPEAQSQSIFDQFADELQQDVQTALLRFLLLQSHGLKQLKQTVTGLKQGLEQGGQARLPGLLSGLDVLRNEDVRNDLQQLACPVLLLLGEKDQLIPVGMLQHALALKPDLQYLVINGAAHQPFLTHREQTRMAVLDFCGMGPDEV